MNYFETAVYAGIGFALKSKEKVEEFAKKLAADQKLSMEEGQKFINDMMASAEDTKAELNAKLEELVRKNLADMGIATKAEVNELKSKIKKLEAAAKKA